MESLRRFKFSFNPLLKSFFCLRYLYYFYTNTRLICKFYSN